MRYYCVYAGWNLKVYFHKKTVQILLRRCLPHLAKSHSYLSSSSSFTGHTAVMMTDSQFHYHISNIHDHSCDRNCCYTQSCICFDPCIPSYWLLNVDDLKILVTYTHRSGQTVSTNVCVHRARQLSLCLLTEPVLLRKTQKVWKTGSLSRPQLPQTVWDRHSW